MPLPLCQISGIRNNPKCSPLKYTAYWTRDVEDLRPHDLDYLHSAFVHIYGERIADDCMHELCLLLAGEHIFKRHSNDDLMQYRPPIRPVEKADFSRWMSAFNDMERAAVTYALLSKMNLRRPFSMTYSSALKCTENEKLHDWLHRLQAVPLNNPVLWAFAPEKKPASLDDFYLKVRETTSMGWWRFAKSVEMSDIAVEKYLPPSLLSD